MPAPELATLARDVLAAIDVAPTPKLPPRPVDDAEQSRWERYADRSAAVLEQRI